MMLYLKFFLQFSSLLNCTFEEAASLASSVIQHICTETFAVTVDEVHLADMKESAGMVFVQSLKELGRYCYYVVLTSNF